MSGIKIVNVRTRERNSPTRLRPGDAAASAGPPNATYAKGRRVSKTAARFGYCPMIRRTAAHIFAETEKSWQHAYAR